MGRGILDIFTSGDPSFFSQEATFLLSVGYLMLYRLVAADPATCITPHDLLRARDRFRSRESQLRGSLAPLALGGDGELEPAHGALVYLAEVAELHAQPQVAEPHDGTSDGRLDPLGLRGGGAGLGLRGGGVGAEGRGWRQR